MFGQSESDGYVAQVQYDPFEGYCGFLFFRNPKFREKKNQLVGTPK